jgi:hypothetical protein
LLLDFGVILAKISRNTATPGRLGEKEMFGLIFRSFAKLENAILFQPYPTLSFATGKYFLYVGKKARD